MNSIPKDEELQIGLVDDHPIVHEALKTLFSLQEGWRVCGCAATASAAKEMIAKTRPQLVIVDLSLKESHGLDLIRDLRVMHPELLMLVFSHHDEVQYAERAVRAGAAGYVMKSEPPQKVVEAIRLMLTGEIYLSPNISKMLLRQTFDRTESKVKSLSTTVGGRLTDREVTVLEFLGRGMATRQIARSLNVSVKTVDAHRANLKRKLGLRDAVELVCYAASWAGDRFAGDGSIRRMPTGDGAAGSLVEEKLDGGRRGISATIAQ